MFQMSWPEKRMISDKEMIAWAKQVIASGLCDLADYSEPDDVNDAWDAMGVLSWTGTATFD